jgi:hypothetical protein
MAGRPWIMAVQQPWPSECARLARQGRVTDHRVGVTEHAVAAVLGGERLCVFLDALALHHRRQLLAALR